MSVNGLHSAFRYVDLNFFWKEGVFMKELAIAFLGLMILFSACPAEAAEFNGPQKGLPSLVMLSTPT